MDAVVVVVQLLFLITCVIVLIVVSPFGFNHVCCDILVGIVIDIGLWGGSVILPPRVVGHGPKGASHSVWGGVVSGPAGWAWLCLAVVSVVFHPCRRRSPFAC